ncbi:hypothetical protein N7493_001228 [Penicillium malachiteum]|uniref:Condensation domain-containing protein n=1 Tax=Penicillium malachiteum TaxID=1324776 RepID=A0AAD6HTU9_9EURO|nr:hypothetical protein N7493_001228 [Penicillium malachiteum]
MGKHLLRFAWCPDCNHEGQHTFVLTWHHALYDRPTFEKFMSSVTEFYYEGTVPQESVTMKSFVQYERSIQMKYLYQISEAEGDNYAIWPKAPSIPSNPRSARGMVQLPDRAD